MSTRENFWNVYCFATNQMLDETAKDSHQTTALISHDLMRNNELIFSSMRNLQFYVFKYWGVVFLDSGFVSPKNRYEINFFGQLGLYALYHCCLCVLFHSACAFLVTFHKGTFFHNTCYSFCGNPELRCSLCHADKAETAVNSC